MEKGSILYGTSGIDITDEVIRDYNKTATKLSSLGDSSAEQKEQAGSDFGDNAAKRSTISK
jgi:hypothetical protein